MSDVRTFWRAGSFGSLGPRGHPKPETFAMIRNKLLRTLTRTALVCLFPPSGIDKIIHWDDAMAQAKSGPLPGAPILLASSVVLETMAPLAIVAERYDREAAALLAGFCGVTAVMYHQFWTFDDLMAKGHSEGREHMWEFLKNFGLVGGLLYVALGDKLLDDPHPDPYRLKPAPQPLGSGRSYDGYR